MHTNGKVWSLLGGWKPRQVLPGDLVHPSVSAKVASSSVPAPGHASFPG